MKLKGKSICLVIFTPRRDECQKKVLVHWVHGRNLGWIIGNNLIVFWKKRKKNLNLWMAQNGKKTTINPVNKWMKEMQRNPSVDHQISNHYFLSWKSSSVNELLTGEQRLWFLAGLIIKRLPSLLYFLWQQDSFSEKADIIVQTGRSKFIKCALAFKSFVVLNNDYYGWNCNFHGPKLSTTN